MQLTNVEEVRDFMKTVDSCEGNVYLKSNQGDVFNLKSSLSEYIAVGRLINEVGSDLELFCDKREDEVKFIHFFDQNPETI